MDASLTPHLGRVVLYTVLGDAEAFVFDFDALSVAQRAALVAGHLAAFAANLKGRGRSVDEFPPFALLGESMPPEPGGTVDLSAPHEGALVTKRTTGAVYYVSAADDLRAWHVADSIAALGFRESCVDRVFTPAELTFEGPPSTHTGFTLEEWATAGNKRSLSIGKRSGLLGFFERVFASS
jgi:hypothetical protein